MTRGRVAATDPFDISAVRRSDEVFDALAARRLPESDDPAAGLLAELVADVDKGAPPLPVPSRSPCGASRRRGVRAVVTFGVAAVVLTSAGAAAAGGNNIGVMDTPHGPMRSAERSNENVRHQEPGALGAFVAGHRPAPRRSDTDALGVPDARPTGHDTHKPEKSGTGKSVKVNKPPNKVAWGKNHPPAAGPVPSPSPSPTSSDPSGGPSPIATSPQPETS